MLLQVKCNNCKYINTEKDIDHADCSNEEGEEYYEYDLFCGSCGKLIVDGSNWGEFDLGEVIEGIKANLYES